MTRYDDDMSEMEQLVTEVLLRERGSSPDVDSEWQRVAARLNPQEVGHRHRILWAAVAAAAAIVVVVLLLWNGLFAADKGVIYAARPSSESIAVVGDDGTEVSVAEQKQSLRASHGAVKMLTITVPEGKDTKIVLADGSEVWLNAGSSLSYPTRFSGNCRRVHLKGEAYFKVRHDARHPFIVDASGWQTKVLGTQFNVRSYSAADTHVTLVEGKVSVNAASSRAVLSPGEDASVVSGRLQVKDVNVDDMVCWRDGIQLFDDASLRDILVQMGSWYNMNIVCRNEKDINARYHFMYDRKESVEKTVEMLRELSKVKLKIEKNTIFVD